jgi:hypothetical protein
MDIDQRFDESARRVFMRIGEAETGVAVSRQISGLVAGRPALAG